MKTFHSVTTVRGLAAFAVCWYHMGLWTGLLPDGVLRASAGFGWLGPHIFFIVSGFVVPWSLYRVSYQVAQAPRYLARRIVRLDPPYILTMLMIVALTFLGSLIGLEKDGFELEWGRIFSHLAYLTEILEFKWYNPVFWTLAIEFQYYLLLAFFFPFLAHTRRSVRWLSMALCLAAYMPFFMKPQTTWLVGYLPLFMLGFLLFQHQAGLIGRKEMWIWAVGLMLLSSSFAYVLGPLAFVAFGLMYEDRFRNKVTEFLGKISYSLYLIHMPVGIPFERIAARFAETDLERIAAALLSTAFCVFAAWVFYLLVEQPSIRLARRISISKPGTAAVTNAGEVGRA